jgi:hypothetical protein
MTKRRRYAKHANKQASHAWARTPNKPHPHLCQQPQPQPLLLVGVVLVTRLALQEHVFQEVDPLLQSLVDGFNVAILA